MMNTIYNPRSNIQEITDYLNEVKGLMNSVNYEIEDYFEKQDLYQVLIEDLPDSKDLSKKQIFIEDICNLSADFFNKTKSKKVRVQVLTINNDKCRLFHSDNNIQRLLCTYHGPGTQWLEESNVRREWLGKGDNNKIIKDISKINNADLFDTLLLKGHKYAPNNQGSVHRSPEVEKYKLDRVLLKIDEY